ncbi:hypothetical protein Tco_0404120 [Tanacetum coccineum]
MEGFRATLKPPIDYKLRTTRKMVPNTFFDVLEHYFWKWQRCVGNDDISNIPSFKLPDRLEFDHESLYLNITSFKLYLGPWKRE